MDFTFVTLILSTGLFIGSYFFYVQLNSSIDQKCDAMMHHVEDLFDDNKLLLFEDFSIIKVFLEKCKIDIDKLKEEIDILKKQKKETPKPMRKIPLKNNDKSLEDNKN